MSQRAVFLITCRPLNCSDLVRRRAYMVYFVLFGKDPDQLQQLEELLAHANQSSAAGVVKPALLVASKVSSSFQVDTFLISPLA